MCGNIGLKKEVPMVNLVVAPEFWISRMLPEGTIERWLVADGATVASDDPVADLRIEGELVRLKAPVAGKLVMEGKPNDIIEPGSVIGQIGPL
jgi:pyruvate/2-oxoglutarate dehydrogenase complex dihydrolipoamide acyltransferase (E2) component